MSFGKRDGPAPSQGNRGGPVGTQAAPSGTKPASNPSAVTAAIELLLRGVPAEDPRRRVILALSSVRVSRRRSRGLFARQPKKILAPVVTESCFGPYAAEFMAALNVDVAENDPLRLSLDGEWNMVSLISLGREASDGASFLLEARDLLFDRRNVEGPYFLNEMWRSLRAGMMSPPAARTQLTGFVAILREQISVLDG